jgi:hypothetical protein
VLNPPEAMTEAAAMVRARFLGLTPERSAPIPNDLAEHDDFHAGVLAEIDAGVVAAEMAQEPTMGWGVATIVGEYRDERSNTLQCAEQPAADGRVEKRRPYHRRHGIGRVTIPPLQKPGDGGPSLREADEIDRAIAHRSHPSQMSVQTVDQLAATGPPRGRLVIIHRLDPPVVEVPHLIRAQLHPLDELGELAFRRLIESGNEKHDHVGRCRRDRRDVPPSLRGCRSKRSEEGGSNPGE